MKGYVVLRLKRIALTDIVMYVLKLLSCSRESFLVFDNVIIFWWTRLFITYTYIYGYWSFLAKEALA